jgi:hypothetical protein
MGFLGQGQWAECDVISSRWDVVLPLSLTMIYRQGVVCACDKCILFKKKCSFATLL